MERRVFLKKVVKSFFLLLGSGLVPAAIYLYPSKIKERGLKFIPVLDEDDIPKKGVKRVDFSYEHDGKKTGRHIFLAALDSGITAFSPVCTHLGCLVSFDRNKNEFICPCHGGKYNIKGDVAGGPPPAPLKRMPLEIKEGKVYIGVTV